MTHEASLTTPTYEPTPDASVRPALRRLLDQVELQLSEYLDAELERWAAVDSRGRQLVQAVVDLTASGGKRLRPAFCLSGYLAAGGGRDAEAVRAAAALEILHTAALIHDDVMDASDYRRGAPSVHAKHSAIHQNANWHGESRRYGESIAMLAGDLAFTYADDLMSGVTARVASLWTVLRTELIVGQYLDMAAAAEFVADIRLARWIAVAKSGRYTIHRPLVLGAAIAGQVDAMPAFEEYGVALGEAFQLRDDLIDAFGDGSVTGKPAGLDLDQHKMTLLLSLAIQRDERVGALAQRSATSALAVADLRDLLVQSGVRYEVEALIDQLVERAQVAIAKAPLDPQWREHLAGMAIKVAYRNK